MLIQANYIFGKGEEIGLKLQKLDMPQEIIECKSIDEVKPYLSDKNELIRMWAVRRIGELGKEEAISELIAVFEGESQATLAKIEVLSTIGNVGGKEAKDTLLTILKKYLDKGPRVKRYDWEDMEYMTIVMKTLEELSRWNDKDVFDSFEKIFLDEKFNWLIRETAYKWYFTIKMKKEGISDFEKEVSYLLKNLKNKGAGDASDWVKGKSGVKTLEAIKNHAIFTKLVEYGELVLPYIKEELEKVPQSEENRRYKALLQVEKAIEIVSERKAMEKDEILDLSLKTNRSLYLDKEKGWEKFEQESLRLLEKYNTPQDKGKIYSAIALNYSRRNSTLPEDMRISKLTEYCEKTLQYPVEVITALKLYHEWGTALIGRYWTAYTEEEFSKKRQEATTVYLNGLKFALDNNAPNKEQELPAITQYSKEELEALRRDLVRKVEVAEQLQDERKNRENVELQNKLYSWRKRFIQECISLYSHPPYNTGELRNLTEDFLKGHDNVVEEVIVEVEKKISNSSGIQVKTE